MAYKEEKPNLLPRLKASIKERKLERFYVFHGEEAFLRNHYLGQMKKILIDDLTESFNYHKLTKENFSPDAFSDAVESLPMMAENTFVLVDDIDLFKLTEDEREKMIDVFSDIPDYCTVVFAYEATLWKPDKRQQKLWKAIETNAVIVEFAKQEQRDLINWVGRHFAANKKQIAPGLCSYLIDITGGTMTVLAGEITKICAFSDADTIVKSGIDAVVEPVLDAVVFDITDCLSQGRYDIALKKMQDVLKKQDEPLSVLGAIGTHFRRIGAARILRDNGKTVTDLEQLCHISNYAARRTMDAAKRFAPEFCALAMELVMETDWGLKTSKDAPDRLMELLILQLAQEARNG